MKFSGDILGSVFQGLEAERPTSVLKMMDPTATMVDLQCWMRIQATKGGKERWAEVFLDIPDYFESLQRFVPDPDEIHVIFRRAAVPVHSSVPMKAFEPNVTLMTLEDSFTRNDESTPNISILSEDLNSATASDTSTATNFHDPISKRPVQEVVDPFPILFYSKKFQSEDSKTLCVSKSALESYVACALNDGEDIFRLRVAQNVGCKDGRKRSFSLTPVVWVQSLLPHSRTLRQLFLKANETALQQRCQLAGLREDKNLWYRVVFWLSDMLSLHDRALKRLSYQSRLGESSIDTPPYLSGFYFTPTEARNLGKIVMSNGTLLQDFLQNSVDLRDDTDAHHALRVQLCRAFHLDDGFHMQATFRQRKAKWIRGRQQDLLGHGL